MTNFKAKVDGKEVFFEIMKSEAFFFSECNGNILVKDNKGVQRIVDSNSLEDITVVSHNFGDTTIYIK